MRLDRELLAARTPLGDLERQRLLLDLAAKSAELPRARDRHWDDSLGGAIMSRKHMICAAARCQCGRQGLWDLVASKIASKAR